MSISHSFEIRDKGNLQNKNLLKQSEMARQPTYLRTARKKGKKVEME